MSSQIATHLNPFRVAVQGLVILAETGKACASATVARTVDAHAVSVRRVMAQLVQAQLVVAYEGRDGGYRLARPADMITLAEVYQAVKGACPSEAAMQSQLLNRRIEQALHEVDAGVEAHLLTLLQKYTIASLMENTAPPL